MPVELAEAMQRELAACRPPVAIEVNASAVIDNAQVATSDVQPSADAEVGPAPDIQAWKQLNDVTNRVPSLM